MKGIITTNSGIHFDLENPTAEMITIEDIASHLSKLCRFTGALDNFYSVAQHSIYCSYIVSDTWALDALMHDAAEAYLGDVSNPLKQLLPEYKRLERVVQFVICEKFGIPFTLPYIVKQADKRSYVKERAAHFSSSPGINDGLHDHLGHVKIPNLALPSHKLSFKEVEQGFLRRFHELTSEV